MITIIHGADISSSRNYLNTLFTTDFIKYSADTTDLEEIIQVLEGGGLFQEQKTIFIENFFSKKNKNQEKLSEYLNNAKNVNLIIWQDRDLTSTELKSFKKADIKEFKLSKFLFSFLDQIRPRNISNVKNFHEALKTTEVELLFFMLTKQIRMLLALKSNSQNQIDETKRLADWQKSKLLKQSSFFPEDKLTLSLKKLAQIDKEIKTGETGFSLIQNVDIWLANL